MKLFTRLCQWWCSHQEIELINIHYSDRHVHMKCQKCHKELNAYF